MSSVSLYGFDSDNPATKYDLGKEVEQMTYW